MRRKSLIVIMMMLLVSSFVFSQEDVETAEASDDESMMTVEEAYLNSMEGVILKEMVYSPGRDSKYVALQVIEDAVESGNLSPEIQAALDSLATVGLTTVVREGGRVANNFPDVRMKACRLLGQIKTEQAKNTLLKVMYQENEPVVVMEAVKALGEIGINNNDEVVEMINFINKKFDIVNPTSSLALEVLNTYEKLAPSTENKSGMVDNIMRIANNYSYVTPVRNRALEVLKAVFAGVSSEGEEDSKESEE